MDGWLVMSRCFIGERRLYTRRHVGENGITVNVTLIYWLILLSCAISLAYGWRSRTPCSRRSLLMPAHCWRSSLAASGYVGIVTRLRFVTAIDRHNITDDEIAVAARHVGIHVRQMPRRLEHYGHWLLAGTGHRHVGNRFDWLHRCRWSRCYHDRNARRYGQHNYRTVARPRHYRRHEYHSFHYVGRVPSYEDRRCRLTVASGSVLDGMALSRQHTTAHC